MVVLCQMMAIMLSANAIVREKEKGTLEQLFMTPVRSGELMLGKMLPYLGLTIVEFCWIAVLMITMFQVPIHGNFLTLLTVALAVFPDDAGRGAVDFHPGADARRLDANVDGHGDPFDLPLGLCLSARFDALVLLVRRQARADDLDDRRLARSDPPRRRLGRTLAQRAGAHRHGNSRPGRQLRHVSKTSRVSCKQDDHVCGFDVLAFAAPLRPGLPPLSERRRGGVVRLGHGECMPQQLPRSSNNHAFVRSRPDDPVHSPDPPLRKGQDDPRHGIGMNCAGMATASVDRPRPRLAV